MGNCTLKCRPPSTVLEWIQRKPGTDQGRKEPKGGLATRSQNFASFVMQTVPMSYDYLEKNSG